MESENIRMSDGLSERRSLLKPLIWFLAYLVVVDAGINLAFKYPDKPSQEPTHLQYYFNYGLSTEGKLAKLTARTLEDSAPTVRNGWMEGPEYSNLPTSIGNEEEKLVALYGMSHTKLLGEALTQVNPRYVTRIVTAPGAIPSWAYSAYLHDRNRYNANVVILGILTEGIALLSSTTGMTAYPEQAHPYTYPRFYAENGTLRRGTPPPFMTWRDYRETFFDSSKWEKYRKWLATNDGFYDPIVFHETILDYSAFIRLIRRAYGQATRNQLIRNVYTRKSGFNEHSEEAEIARMIILEFSRNVRESGALPIIYIVNTQGNSDHLFRLLEPVLKENAIPYLSTHIICPPDDPRVFLASNSHFIPSMDLELAHELDGIIVGNE